VFWLAAIPGALAIVTVILFVREVAPTRSAAGNKTGALGAPAENQQGLPRSFWYYLAILLVFTLGNSTDAFLLLRANELGVPVALAPILWATLHVVKSATSTPGGALSDRIGRRPTLVMGWLLYAAVYLGFALADSAWHAWALFGVYGVFFGLTEGSERALVADLVALERRGTAFGWYNLAIGLGALPASLLFGLVWDRAGSGAAFTMGAALALVAAVGLVAATLGRQQQRLPGRS
jgi:MFS family permease